MGKTQTNKYFYIAIFLLIILLISSIIFYFLKDTEESFIEMTSDFEGLKDIDILMSYKDNILVNNGEIGEWDESIREIGNIIFHPTLGKYFFFYSGYNDDYSGDNVFVGMAYSYDFKNWDKYGKIIDLPSEDPYVILYENKFYLYFEDKSEIPFRKINLATSDDGENWTIAKQGVILPTNNSDWQSRDVSSPVVIEKIDGWVMLYEGRSPDNLGKVGYAYSDDLINWSKKEEPVFEGSENWANHVVPDDIIKENDDYILTYHGYCEEYGWQVGLAISTNLLNWRSLNSLPIHPSAPMLTQINSEIYFFGETDRGVEFYIPLKGLKRDNSNK